MDSEWTLKIKKHCAVFLVVFQGLVTREKLIQCFVAQKRKIRLWEGSVQGQTLSSNKAQINLRWQAFPAINTYELAKALLAALLSIISLYSNSGYLFTATCGDLTKRTIVNHVCTTG